MTKSIRFGKTLTKMQNLKQSLLLIAVIGISLGACKSKVAYQEKAYIEPYLKDSIPYSLAMHEPKSDHLLLFLPPVLDEVKFEETDLYRKLYEAGYDILSVYKAPARGAYFYTRKAMDFKNQNVQNVQNLIQHLRRSGVLNKKAKTHILAIEQGVYIAPSLANTYKADTVLLINANPFSTYYGFQRITEGKIPFDESQRNMVKELFDIDSLDVLKEKVAEVEQTTSDYYSLGKFTNMYWLSYHANYYIEEYAAFEGHSCWLYFNGYPLYKESDVQYQKLLDKTRANSSANHYILDGLGRFKNKSDWDKIEEALEPYLKD